MDENRTDNTNYEPNFIMTDPDESGAAAAGGAAGTDAALNSAGAGAAGYLVQVRPRTALIPVHIRGSGSSGFNAATYTGSYTDPRDNFRKQTVSMK